MKMIVGKKKALNYPPNLEFTRSNSVLWQFTYNISRELRCLAQFDDWIQSQLFDNINYSTAAG